MLRLIILTAAGMSFDWLANFSAA